MTIDFASASFALALLTLIVAIPVVALMIRDGDLSRSAVVMLALVLLASTTAGVVGAFGRLADEDALIDRIVRILLIALRVFALGGLVSLTRELWASRQEGP